MSRFRDALHVILRTKVAVYPEQIPVADGEDIMADMPQTDSAISDANAALARVGALVTSLQGQVATLTSQLQAAQGEVNDADGQAAGDIEGLVNTMNQIAPPPQTTSETTTTTDSSDPTASNQAEGSQAAGAATGTPQAAS